MARIPLHFLPAFVAVAERGSLRAAAQALHLTHSAVSQQLSELESRLGFTLFDRRARRVSLNPAGEALLLSARQALATIDDGVQRAASMAHQAAWTLRLTMPVAFAQRWFLPRLARWYERHPDIQIEVDVSPQMRDLQREGFHAAIRSSNSTAAGGLVKQPLYDAPCRVLAVAAPALAQRLHAGEPAGLRHERLLGFGEEWAYWFTAAGLTAAPAEPTAAFNSLSLLLGAAEQGLGVGLARELLVADAICRDALRPLFGVQCVREDVSPHGLVYPGSLSTWPPLVALRDWIQSEAEATMRALHQHATPTRI